MNPVEVLRAVPFFAGLNQNQLETVQRVSEIQHFPKDAILFREGDRGNALYVVLSGRVKVVKLADDGREFILASFGPGELFGEMALFDADEKRTATVVTFEPSSLLVISGKLFMAMLMENPAISLSLLRTVTQRLKESSARFANLIFLDTYSRVGNYLVKMAQDGGRRLADGSLVITRPPQQEIADFVGSSRETVSRALKELEHQGLIRMIGKKVILSRLKP